MSSYKVGFGKPPVETRFKKGQSGNPRGRPKGSRNLTSIIRDAMAQQVVVTVDGQRTTMSKLQAAVVQQANKAAQGDLKATQLLFQLLLAQEAQDATQIGVPAETAEERLRRDRVVLAALKARLQGGSDVGDA